MLRKIIAVLLLTVAVVCPATAQSRDVPREDVAYAKAMDNYYEQLTLRSDVNAHNETVTGVLNDFDGRVIVEAFMGSDFYMLLWDAGLEGVVILRNGEEIELTTYTDEHGRPAFETDDISGWVDVLGNELHVRASMPGLERGWMGEIPAEGDDGAGPIGIIADETKECVCKGSQKKCENFEDCVDEEPCTLPNGTGAKCVYVAVTKKKKGMPTSSCGRAGMFIPGGLLFTGVITFCGPVRRSAMRCVRRSL